MFGKRIRELRRQKGMTQKQLSIAIGATQATISQYEGGVRIPSPFFRRKLEEVLGVSLEQLSKPRLDGTLDHVKELTLVARELPDAYLIVLLELARLLKGRELSLMDLPEREQQLYETSILPDLGQG